MGVKLAKPWGKMWLTLEEKNMARNWQYFKQSQSRRAPKAGGQPYGVSQGWAERSTVEDSLG